MTRERSQKRIELEQRSKMTRECAALLLKFRASPSCERNLTAKDLEECALSIRPDLLSDVYFLADILAPQELVGYAFYLEANLSPDLLSIYLLEQEKVINGRQR
jgi:hypothetical protein